MPAECESADAHREAYRATKAAVRRVISLPSCSKEDIATCRTTSARDGRVLLEASAVQGAEGIAELACNSAADAESSLPEAHA